MATIPDSFMLLASIMALAAALAYGKRKCSYIVAMWALPLFWIALYYGAMSFRAEPIYSSLELRMALFRPGHLFLPPLITAFLLNGKLNQLIDQAVTRWTNLSKR